MAESISVILPDGSSKQVEADATVRDVAASIGAGLAKAAIAGVINGTITDLETTVADGDQIEILTAKDPRGLGIIRHSCSHIMAEAVQDLWPGAQIAFGPQTEDGFFYDFALDHSISTDDFDKIEARMAEIIKADEPFVREVVTAAEAREVFADQRFKLERIDAFEDGDTISIYRHGSFADLCRGPHIPSTKLIGAFQLNKVAGAYWKGDAANEMLQRLYGTAFTSKKELDAYNYQIEEAKKRNHRVLGPKLGIFEMIDMAGPGLPLYFPNGARIMRTMQEWLRKELYRRGYDEVITPHIYKADVWKTSGHYDFYHDNMYFFNVNEHGEKPQDTDSGTRQLAEFGVKPMNCPGHVLLYKSNLHSYREMPIRLFEFGTVYRHELSGAVNGLFRARGFTQDDAHLFCREDQVIEEVEAIMDLIDLIMATFDLSYEAEVSTRPEHSIGTDEMWEKAERFLKTALDNRGLSYDINEGDGAFYGPKIDIKVKDSLGRTWQCSTIQVDFNLPERFDISYRTADNTEARPWMLHRAIFGSFERILGILIEHTAGNLPLWLAPVQVAVVPIADRHLDYARHVADAIRAAGGRVELSSQSEPMRAKIAKAQDQKIPYMLVVGDKEAEDGNVSVRERSQGDLGTQSLDEFLSLIADACV